MGPSLRSSSSLSATSKPADEQEVDEDTTMETTKQVSSSAKKGDGSKAKRQKRSTSKATGTATTAAADDDDSKTKTEKVKGKPKKGDKKNDDNNSSDDDEDASSLPPAKKKKAAAAKQATVPPPSESDNEEDMKDDSKTKTKKKAKPPTHQVLTERVDLPKLWDASKAATASSKGSYTFKIASWNVAGLRGCIKKTPTILADFVLEHNLDCLCLQETKLNEVNVDDPKLNIPKLEEHGYEAYYSCSTAKKGYSGTAVFVRKHKGTTTTNDNNNAATAAAGTKKKKKQSTLDSFVGTTAATSSKKTSGSDMKNSLDDDDDLPIDPQLLIPEQVSFKMGIDKHDQEGRIIVVDFPLFTMVNVYVPNSGQKLERLDYRTNEWDKDLLAFMQSRQQQKASKDKKINHHPVLWCGDLNVAHTNLEVWNDGAKHLPKQAGVTPQERASFQAQLDAGFVDAFRRLHPTAEGGHYSYWSQRAGNRAPNKGLRLDYFICDPSMFHDTSKVVVRDSYMIFDQEGSDHCPVVLELEIKP